MKFLRLTFLVVAIGTLYLAVVQGSMQAQTPVTGDWRFGVVESYTAPNSAREMGLAWTRVRFQWAEVQRGGPDTWTPEVADELIEQELAAGRLVVGLLIGIPEWARDENGLPEGLWLAHDDPDNTWATFVREIVSRYAGRIDHWIIWNEPDIDASAVAHTWNGTVEDFAQLQRVAYLVANEANPDAVIHLAAFTYWADANAQREQYMARLLDAFLADPEAAQHGYYFDVATAHLYFQPDQIYNLLTLFQDMMRERGIYKPIWLVETNAPPHDDPSWPVPEHTLSVMQDEQAAFMPQALASALAAGAERIAVYKMQDTVDDRQANPEPFGLLRLDGSRRPAFHALKVAVEYMRGSREITRERWDEVGQFRLLQEDRQTTVLFARLADPQQATVPAIAERALLVDLRGTKEWVDAADGAYVIELPPALCIQTIGDYCMIGGSTYYLVQSLDGSDPPEGLPPLLPQPTSTPTGLPTSTATATVSATNTPPLPATATPLPPSPTMAPPEPLPSATISSPSTSIANAPGATPTAVALAASGAAREESPIGILLLGAFALAAAGFGLWYFNKRP